MYNPVNTLKFMLHQLEIVHFKGCVFSGGGGIYHLLKYCKNSIKEIRWTKSIQNLKVLESIFLVHLMNFSIK